MANNEGATHINCAPAGYEHSYQKTKRRVRTRRGVMWLGQTCNLRCEFCYFLDRIKAKEHPEHPFMSLSKAQYICSKLVEHYSNNAIDIQGGEPMIYPDIYKLVEYCRKIGLLPTLITNALVLANKDKCQRLVDSGIRDLLVSVHALGATYDGIVGVPGASQKQMQALENLRECDIPFRFNCVVSKSALLQLGEIARLAVGAGARVVNFIAFNPFEDQQMSGKRSSRNVPSYGEISLCLNEALDILEKGDVECNVRYLPICIVEPKHRKSMYNFQQLPYDLHEWDFESWSWTGLKAQRIRDGAPDPLVSLQECTYRQVRYKGPLAIIADAVRAFVHKYPQMRQPAAVINRGLSILVHGKDHYDSADDLLRAAAKLRASAHCRYAYIKDCEVCAAEGICDGLHQDSANFFGTDGIAPIPNSFPICDPKYFIKEQEKVVEHEDYGWAL